MRLNIEERAFGDSRRKKLAHLLGVKENLVMGVLVLLWHGSQEAEVTETSKEDILDWCEEFDPAGREKLFNALLKSGYITAIGEDTYRIKGNDKHVEKLTQLRSAARRGGKSKTKKTLTELETKPEAEGEKEKCLQAEKKEAQGKTEKNEKCLQAEKSLPNALALARQCISNTDKEKREKKKAGESPEESPSSSGATTPDIPPKPNRKIPKKWKTKISEFDTELAGRWLSFAREQVPRGRFNEVEFQVAVTKMRHEYKLSEADITALFAWCQESEFWRDKSFSPVGLLKRKGEKSNLDTILMQKSQEGRSLPPSKRSHSKVDDGHVEYKRRLIAKVKAEQEGIT